MSSTTPSTIIGLSFSMSATPGEVAGSRARHGVTRSGARYTRQVRGFTRNHKD
jgi:hypothetical protein